MNDVLMYIFAAGTGAGVIAMLTAAAMAEVRRRRKSSKNSAD